MTTAKYLKNGMLAVVLGLASATAMAEMDASEFVDEATAKGIAEIEAGKLALETSQNSEVQQFAEKMIEDHTKANQKLREMAQQKNLEVADDATLMDQGKVMIMEMRDGEGFDSHYASNQVNAHEQTIELFETAQEELNDKELREFAKETLPKLREHLAEAKELEARFEAEDN